MIDRGGGSVILGTVEQRSDQLLDSAGLRFLHDAGEAEMHLDLVPGLPFARNAQEAVLEGLTGYYGSYLDNKVVITDYNNRRKGEPFEKYFHIDEIDRNYKLVSDTYVWKLKKYYIMGTQTYIRYISI